MQIGVAGWKIFLQQFAVAPKPVSRLLKSFLAVEFQNRDELFAEFGR